MADICADCGSNMREFWKTHPPSESNPAICRQCERLGPKTDYPEDERQMQLEKPKAFPDSLYSHGDTPGISIVLYIICALSILGGILLATQGAVIWLFVALIEVAFLIGFIAMINYLFQAKNSLHFIENMLKNQIDQDRGDY